MYSKYIYTYRIKNVHISYTGKYLYDGEFQVHVPVVEIFRFL